MRGGCQVVCRVVGSRGWEVGAESTNRVCSARLGVNAFPKFPLPTPTPHTPSNEAVESPTMSLLVQRKGPPAPLPRIEGKEILTGPNPEIAKVKGVMFGGRK